MCGIGGILRVWPVDQRELALATPHHQSIPEAWLDILDDSIRHRGPDGQGRFRDRAIRADGCVVDVAFVHRRLSIIDHAGGAQPMVSSSPSPREGSGVGSFGVGPRGDLPPPLLFHGKPNDPVVYRPIPNASPDLVAVAFNGCIYNHRELRTELQRAGHVFTTDHSDTEVLVHGWREWGTAWPEHMEGMFATAMWSPSHGLMLATDHYAEKPLWTANWRLASFDVGRPETDLRAWASSAAGLLRLFRGTGLDLRGFDAEPLRPIAMSDWIEYGYGGCMLGLKQQIGFGIQALSPSSSVCVEHTGEISSRRYEPARLRGRWLERAEKTRPSRDDSPTPEAIEATLVEAVQRRVEADVPLGCFLSGGVDSSLVAAIAMRVRGKLQTFTVSMPDPRYDEASFAESAAAHIGSAHRTLTCDANPTEDLSAIIQQIGIPFGDSSLLPSLWVSRAAAREVRVTLGGDGADELFAGYERLIACRWLEVYGNVVSRLPLDWFSERDPKSRSARAAKLIRAARGAGYDDLAAIFTEDDLAPLLSRSPRHLQSVRSQVPQVRRIASQAVGLFRSPERAIELDIRRYLPGDILVKLDSAAMSAALETRCPYLDTGVASVVRWASLSSLMPRGSGMRGRKGLLRQVARKYLPAEIVDRPKMGFAIPIGEWFRTDYGGLRTMLLDHLNSTEPFGPPSLGIELNMSFIRQMLDEHLGTGRSGLVKRDHSQRLYMLLVLSIWAKWMGSSKA